jgi:ABC-type oligopeptide transport system substrate-binding subunit
LAIALWQQDGKPSEAASEPIQLTLVYPPSEIARRAVRAMQQQLLLNEMGISLQLREGSTADQLPAESWDVQYIEWPAMEPVIDAARLLGQGGVAQIVNSGIKPTLERLAQSATMADAQSVLHELHRLAHSECLVIPLWQLDEFFLYHKSLTGVGTRPTTLYQSIEDWKMELD